MNQKTTRHWITWVILIWTFAITISRAIRWPNDFSEAHWLIDYRFGFVKRGLIGTVSRVVTDLIGLHMSPRLIAVLSFSTLCSMSVAMFYILYRAFRRQQQKDGILLLGIVFAASPFVVMSAHLLGYFDALLYLLTIISVGLVLCDRPYLAALVSVAAILSHESYLLTGLPLVCLASVAMLTAKGHRSCWRRHIIAICIPVAAFLAMSVLQSLTTDAAVLRSQFIKHLASFRFVQTRCREVAGWQTTTFMEFFRQQNRHFGRRLLCPVLLGSVGPTLMAFLAFIHSSFRIRPFSPFSIMLLGAVCAPLAMHAVAWDTERISTYPIAGAFITFWILAETRTVRRTDHLFILVALPALILNAFGRIPLMDYEVERFSATRRLLLYFPAIVLFIATVIRRGGSDWSLARRAHVAYFINANRAAIDQ